MGSRTRNLLDTTLRIEIDDELPAELLDAAGDYLDELEARVSPMASGSELSRMLRGETDPAAVRRDVRELAALIAGAGGATNGLVAAWLTDRIAAFLRLAGARGFRLSLDDASGAGRPAQRALLAPSPLVPLA